MAKHPGDDGHTTWYGTLKGRLEVSDGWSLTWSWRTPSLHEEARTGPADPTPGIIGQWRTLIDGLQAARANGIEALTIAAPAHLVAGLRHTTPDDPNLRAIIAEARAALSAFMGVTYTE